MHHLLLFLGALLVTTSPLQAQIRSTATGGPWNEASTWEGGIIPDSSSTVILTDGAIVDIEPPAACRTLTIESGAMLRGDNNLRLLVDGKLTHRGVIAGEGAVVQANGDILSTGSWEGTLYLGGDGGRTVNIPEHDGEVWVIGNVFLEGYNLLARLDAIADRRGSLVVEPGGTLRFTKAPEVGYVPADIGHDFEPTFSTHGTVIVPNVPSQFNNVLVGSQMLSSLSSAHDDTLTVETHAAQTHPRFADAVRIWWRLSWADTPTSSAPDLMSLFLTFKERELGRFAIEDLLVYHSDDSGETWAPVPNSEHAIVAQNDGTVAVTLLNVPSQGDYVIASAQPPVNARPSSTIRVSGAEQIRIGGPPARYRLYYTNTSDVPVGRTLIGVKTDGGVYIDSVIPSSAEKDGPNSPDAWGVDVFSPAGDSTEALLLTSPLAPREGRAITVYLRAVPNEGENSTEKRIAAPAIAGALVMGIASGYATDFFFHAAEEFMADPCNQRSDIRGKLGTAFDRTDDKWNPFGNSESPYLAAAENGANELAESGFIKKGFGVVGIINNVESAASTVANGTDRYEQNTGRSIWEPVNCDPPPPPIIPRDPKDLDPVQSWDPNAKAGPDGEGDLNHISSAGRIEYTIFFENKAEATAPAYRIVITDTLSDVFDASSVRFGTTSHDGWTIQREGDVLTWEIEGIELPPNETPPEGEGFVSFSVRTRDGLPSGTTLANTATIWFDLNDPIVTNTHVNTLDFDAPTTTMESLPASVSSENVTVRWSSDDHENGSGVASTVVYMSRDGGPFEAVAATDSSKWEAKLDFGHSYSFYALAADRVGNAEQSRPDPVSTSVVPTSAEDETPFVFALHQNYPNPFNPATTIRYSLATAERVRLTIYDVLGRAVAVLLDERRPAGAHELHANLQDLASGLYVYRIEAGSFLSSKSMLLVR